MRRGNPRFRAPEGGGRHTLECDASTTVVTEAEIEIDKTVVLDGRGQLTLDADGQHTVASVLPGAVVELRGFSVKRGTLGVLNRGTLTLTDSTVSGKSGSGQHAVDGIFHFRNALTLSNSTIVDLLYAVGPGTVTSAATLFVGYSFEEFPYDLIDWVSEGYNFGCDFDGPTDLGGANPNDLKLGPLQANGGPTETHALGEGSVAIEPIPAEDCEVETDQRSFPRESICDVGAFEVQP